MAVYQGQEVEVYRNLNRRGVWFSFRDRKSGLVTDRIDLKNGDKACLKACSFKVSQAGRERVLREKRKNVHALIRGEIIAYSHFLEDNKDLLAWRVKYDPYDRACFVGIGEGMRKRVPLLNAVYVTFDANGVTAWTVR